ncbi:hypothetical protein, partial [Streptomyces sp. PH10-H1]|uniref:hypothetical protein n=1 Tax=Streptomyces sp. PH10-H1 TaxID=3046212 RepID=UPI0024BB20FF
KAKGTGKRRNGREIYAARDHLATHEIAGVVPPEVESPDEEFVCAVFRNSKPEAFQAFALNVGRIELAEFDFYGVSDDP